MATEIRWKSNLEAFGSRYQQIARVMTTSPHTILLEFHFPEGESLGLHSVVQLCANTGNKTNPYHQCWKIKAAGSLSRWKGRACRTAASWDAFHLQKKSNGRHLETIILHRWWVPNTSVLQLVTAAAILSLSPHTCLSFFTVMYCIAKTWLLSQKHLTLANNSF